MTTAQFCPQCGKPLPSDGPQGQCPACLLKAALPGESAEAFTLTGSNESSPLHPSSLIPHPFTEADAGTHVRYFGDYELLEEIARGGMGVVWKARQTSLKREVALKMIRAGALADADEVQRFLREAEAAANLQHPNIVAIHEVGEHDGQHYFSMDYVAGRDLGTIVKDGPLAPQVAARYVKIIAEAIHFAHQRGTLHRDLKPQNVLIDANDQPRITDFGLAKLMKDESRLTQPGAVMGSPSYMPPEQAAGRHGDVGPASDVYSMGAMFYELLTGRPPFHGATALATLAAVMEDEPTAPRKLKADIPPDLETICLKCLEKSPTARYPTARALAEELDRFLKGEPILARPAGMVRKMVSWARRHPTALAALAALIMVALAFGVFYLFEENAFLRAQQADPTLARVQGPRHESLNTWAVYHFFVTMAGLYFNVILAHLARAGSLRHLTRTQWYKRDVSGLPLQPLGDRMRSFAMCAGLALIGFGIAQLMYTIQAYVWEGGSIFLQVGGIFLTIFFGLATLAVVIRDYRLVHYGTASRQLTDEQLEPIRRAMKDWDVGTAIRLYREGVPDAGVVEASQYVTRLADSLKGQHPGKFVPPPLWLATFNWKLMSICAAIEAVLFGIYWATLGRFRSDAGRFLWPFAYTVLLGTVWQAFTHVQGFSKRLHVPVYVVSMFVIFILAFGPEENWPYLGGISFGLFLMSSSCLTPRRRKGPSKP